MTGWRTAGEWFAERELATERRAGVEHYVLGQHAAVEITPDDPREGEGLAAFLSYCSPLGLVIVAMVKPEGEDWQPLVRQCRLVGLSADYGARPLPNDWTLTEPMRAVLDEAVNRG